MFRTKIPKVTVFFVLSFSWGLSQTPQPSSSALGYHPGYQLDEHLDQARLAILPLGSIEYHGPSGPLLADSIIAEGLTRRLADRVESAAILPIHSFTHSPAHSAAFRGTISVRPEVITMLIADVLESLVSHGFRKVFILNGHDGNIGPARAAMSQVTNRHKDLQVALVSWWETLPGSEVEQLQLFTSGNGGHGHGGPLELSVTAAFAPDSVEPGKGPDLPALQTPYDFPVYLEKADVTGWPGYSGKLSEISAEKGERLVEISLQKLADFVRYWLENDKKPGSW